MGVYVGRYFKAQFTGRRINEKNRSITSVGQLSRSSNDLLQQRDVIECGVELPADLDNPLIMFQQDSV
jgi:hypothetical protein